MGSDSSASTARGNHFSCSMSAVLLACVRDACGPEAVADVLKIAASERSPEYLTDLSNWISYDEAVALWRAGAEVTHHPQFSRLVGEAAARRLNASPVAALLRSLGSPENVYRQIAVTATKFSAVVDFEAAGVGPGFAELIAVPAAGFPRSAEHCAWTCGLLTADADPVRLAPRPRSRTLSAPPLAPTVATTLSAGRSRSRAAGRVLGARGRPARAARRHARAAAQHVRHRVRPDRGRGGRRCAGPHHRPSRARGPRPSVFAGRAHEPRAARCTATTRALTRRGAGACRSDPRAAPRLVPGVVARRSGALQAPGLRSAAGHERAQPRLLPAGARAVRGLRPLCRQRPRRRHRAARGQAPLRPVERPAQPGPRAGRGGHERRGGATAGRCRARGRRLRPGRRVPVGRALGELVNAPPRRARTRPGPTDGRAARWAAEVERAAERSARRADVRRPRARRPRTAGPARPRSAPPR